MNSKERVIATIGGKKADRLPTDLWALTPVTDRLRNHFGVFSDEEVWKLLEIDIRSIWPEYTGPELEQYSDGSWKDWWGIRKRHLGSFEVIDEHPLENANRMEEIEEYSWPQPGWFDFSSLREKAEVFKDYAIVIRDPGPYSTCSLRVAMFLRSMSKFMLDLVERPHFAKAILNKVLQFYLQLNEKILEEVADFIDIYFIADDLGTQDGLMISPAMFVEFIEPILKQFIDQGKKYGKYVMYHSCGAIKQLIPKFIELGVDILNPIQVSAKGMDPREIKEKFGDKLCFHGGVDVQRLLVRSTPEEIKKQVVQLSMILGKNGGYILAPTNNIMPETPLENILAMYDI